MMVLPGVRSGLPYTMRAAVPPMPPLYCQGVCAGVGRSCWVKVFIAARSPVSHASSCAICWKTGVRCCGGHGVFWVGSVMVGTAPQMVGRSGGGFYLASP